MIHEVPLVNNQIMLELQPTAHIQLMVMIMICHLDMTLGEPDTNRLAQGEGAESHDALIKLRENRQTGIQNCDTTKSDRGFG